MITPTRADNKKRYGQHYTPNELADFLAERTLAFTRPDSTSITIVDPACGDGELLIAAHEAALSAGHKGTVNLIGYEIDETAIQVAQERLESAGLSAELIHGDFLTCQRTLESDSVDLIITNPPYVRTQHLGQEASRLLAEEFGLTGRVDLTHPFVSVAARLLRPGGTLGLLCSNRFLTTLSGENVRRTLLAPDLAINELYDLGDTKIFQAAVLPAIIIVSKAASKVTPAKYISAYESPEQNGLPDMSLFDALRSTESCTAYENGKVYDIKVGTFSPPEDTKTPWRLSNPLSDQWLATIERRTWKTFGDIAKIRVGIKTTADKVFLNTDWKSVAPDVEQELLLPLITQTNITPWRTTDELEMRVLYPYDLNSETRKLLDIDRWPGAKEYLWRHEEKLRGRKYVTDGGREWYEIWVPQRPALWSEPKIVFPDISENPRFAIDNSGAVVNGNCYWISLRDIGDEDIAYLMLAVANSTLGTRFYDEVCGNRLYSGKRRWITQYVKRLPLPDPSTFEAQQVIAHARVLANSTEITEEQLSMMDDSVAAAFTATPQHDTVESLIAQI